MLHSKTKLTLSANTQRTPQFLACVAVADVAVQSLHRIVHSSSYTWGANDAAVMQALLDQRDSAAQQFNEVEEVVGDVAERFNTLRDRVRPLMRQLEDAVAAGRVWPDLLQRGPDGGNPTVRRLLRGGDVDGAAPAHAHKHDHDRTTSSGAREMFLSPASMSQGTPRNAVDSPVDLVATAGTFEHRSLVMPSLGSGNSFAEAMSSAPSFPPPSVDTSATGGGVPSTSLSHRQWHNAGGRGSPVPVSPRSRGICEQCRREASTAAQTIDLRYVEVDACWVPSGCSPPHPLIIQVLALPGRTTEASPHWQRPHPREPVESREQP